MLDVHKGNVERLTIGLIPQRSPGTVPARPDGRSPEPSPREFVVIHFTAPTRVTGPIIQNATAAESNYLGYRLIVEGGNSWFQPDDRTLVMSSQELVKLAIAGGKQSRLKIADSDGWRAVAANPFAVALNIDGARTWFESFAAQADWLQPYAPLWADTTAVYAGAALDKQIQLVGTVQCREPSDVGTVADTISAALTLAKNTSVRYRGRLGELSGDDRPVATILLDLADSLLNSARVERQAGNQVRISSASQVTPDTLRTISTAFARSSAASGRAVASNNLKQLMLAMHNYHSAHGHFPPAVVLGRDGKGGMPHSWRIALLPFIEQNQLHQSYRFDEPWDSESNLKLLAQMPAVYRSPSDAPESTKSGYFALVGPGTVFSKPGGIALHDILDGTSNTIALVEARRDVPWTKPEDIAYSPDKPLPVLGVDPDPNIQVAFCDGSVRVLSRKVDANLLRAMITIAGQEVIALP
jgi:hypothetical protein